MKKIFFHDILLFRGIEKKNYFIWIIFIFYLFPIAFSSYPDFRRESIIYSKSIILEWSGAAECDYPIHFNCSNSTFPVKSFACSMEGYGDWNEGRKNFFDPIPPGHNLIHVDITFNGLFFCSPSEPKATFFALINEMLVLWNRFPMDIQGCDCNVTQCFLSANFSSNDHEMDYSSYHYNQENVFQIELITNQICLSSVNLTLYYNPMNINITKISPQRGPTTGGTNVFVTSSKLPNITADWMCQFGDTSPVRAKYIDENTLNCTTPAVAFPGNYQFKVSINGHDFSTTNFTFEYFGDDSDYPFDKLLKKYWWLFLAGSLFLIFSIGFFFLIFLRKKNQIIRQSSSTPLLANYQKTNQSYSMIKDNIDFREIQLAERVGRGNFGEVFKGYWRGTVVAVKKMKIPFDSDESEFLASFEHEAEIMRSLRHPNVLQFLGICHAGESEICIITEFMPRGSLYKILHNKSLQMEWSLRVKIAIDVARGMNYLHKSNPVIVHRDLKSHNLLVDDNFKVKVCDFGLARLVNNQTIGTMTSCGTPAWTAPEVLRNEKYTKKCDVYSFGIVLWELVTREDPHHGMPPFQVVFAVGTQGIRPPIPDTCPKDFSALIEECWAEDPSIRPEFYEIVERLDLHGNKYFQKF